MIAVNYVFALTLTTDEPFNERSSELGSAVRLMIQTAKEKEYSNLSVRFYVEGTRAWPRAA